MSNQANRPTPYPLRLEPGLSEWVKARAKDNDRSINAELNRLIKQAKEAEKQAYMP
ncbi:Arc family DNA-binding protein [Thiothrix fructosivorans]|uniref:Arc family DNA-binding protein n=1 Tax=Thiothrix fructosivorans TaxID=111770 RepID=A0A8B0SIV7_9GAMM|nr:Arc family DNA-binding protein [Thiothrix fructosivorans]MBO0613691.1 Arc family DNA-binding protein [Thiothrix fructosivorans]QTX10895.1 Arc family DNA-binding protein [Thiothrix fructosivorans]